MRTAIALTLAVLAAACAGAPARTLPGPGSMSPAGQPELDPRLHAARPQEESGATPGRSFTITGGIGTSMGWYGAQIERYSWNSRVSLFGGLGRSFSANADHPAGLAFAAGGRAFTAGVSHRAFVCLTIGLLMITSSGFEDEVVESEKHYGPAILGGYQYVADGGFTIMTALGIGYVGGDLGRPAPALDLGLGYTWR